MAAEELKHAAAYCGLDDEPAALALGGFFCVLKKSQNLAKSDDDDDKKQAYVTIMNGIVDSQQMLQDYESTAFRASLPNPLTMLLPRPDFAPPGPPPWVVGRALAKGIKKATRQDKDAGNTQEVVHVLVKKGLEEAAVLGFMETFIGFVYNNWQTDLTDILCLPDSS